MTLVVARIGLGLTARDRSWLSIRGALSLVLIGAIIVADGGTESPFFFWLLLALSWQALLFEGPAFRRLTLVGGALYIAMVVVAGDITAQSIARFGLFVAFVSVLVIGRAAVDRYRSDVRRLDGMLETLISDVPIGVAVFDADHERLLYANAAASAIGIDDRDSMARLVAEGARHGAHIVTLATIMDQTGSVAAPSRVYVPIGHEHRRMRIGLQPSRVRGADPVMIVYGEEVPDGEGVTTGGTDDDSDR